MAVILLATVNCDAFVKGWIWDEYLPGYHCKGLPVSQDSFNHLGIPWEHYVVEKSDWLIEDFSGFEICLPQQGMRIFRCFTFRGRMPPSHSNTDKDNDISFFVMGLYDGCSLEELYSSRTVTLEHDTNKANIDTIKNLIILNIILFQIMNFFILT